MDWNICINESWIKFIHLIKRAHYKPDKLILQGSRGSKVIWLSLFYSFQITINAWNCLEAWTHFPLKLSNKGCRKNVRWFFLWNMKFFMTYSGMSSGGKWAYFFLQETEKVMWDKEKVGRFLLNEMHHKLANFAYFSLWTRLLFFQDLW